ncbi:MAG: HIT family protein [Porphyromonadaceae bacterium]|nr:HIT family protein [Porphyromonadaceae bacterium]
MSTIFSRIIRGEIPSHRIAETEQFYAFLDINPVQMGHTLIVPKREEDYFFDLSNDELGAMMSFAKVVASAIKAATKCQKVGLAVMGLEINHAHLHLVPINGLGDMDFTQKLDPQEGELASWAKRIGAYLPEEYL